ncbi:GntR family transcriptional regulator [Streptomyces sp. A3M-1-3]|uniref:GntR family transcriptional regulator n=1 Tax=Streptomyces sp. A3M-1-3 TaxID=2962044 RepID=UPI0020B7A669|nr:GntR family transcriptional regulator [Streptomyces sp. A3M-1-3]MCP3820019.1 GntR family transcriptional regulator [Streptomyces sp. A3M-1-3]
MEDAPGHQDDSRTQALRYAGVADAIRTAVNSGSMTPGTRLPAERELARQHAVHRQTVRQALQLLREEGLVSTDRRGTVVRRPGSRAELLQAPSEVLFPLGALTAGSHNRITTRLSWEPVPAAYAAQLGSTPAARTLVHHYRAVSSTGDVTLHAVSYLSPTAVTEIPLLSRYRRHLPHHSHSDLRRLYQWMADAGMALEHSEALTLAAPQGAGPAAPRVRIQRHVRDQYHRTLEISRITPAGGDLTYRFTAPAKPAFQPA